MAGGKTCLGKAWGDTPLQLSAVSHPPAEARHSKLLGFTTSAGQLTPVPVHVSSASQTSPEPGRHTVEAGWKTSTGQAWVATPLQLSAVSHTPADARHSKLLGFTRSAEH